MPDFLLYAISVGVGIAFIAGPLGAFAVWRKLSYFGDTLAHSALIGIALGLFLEINITVSITLACSLIAIILVALEHNNNLSADTLLGVLSHGSLALGLVCVSLYSDTRINLYGYLFGDFLTVELKEVAMIYVAIVAIAVPLFVFWKSMLMISVDEDLAQVEGINVIRIKLLLMLMIACIIALAMKIVGIMLITALLIIPAATARRFARSPESMAVLASVIGILSVIFGLYSSYFWDIPAGPAVVLSALTIFVIGLTMPLAKRN